MLPDTTAVTTIDPKLVDWVDFVRALMSILGGGGIVGLLVLYFTRVLPWCRDRRKKRSLEKRLGAEMYPVEVLQNSVRNYIEPDCQSVDPSGGEDSRLVFGARQNMFKAVDNALFQNTEYRFLIILADSGMGKSSFLLNYYVRNLRKRHNKLNLHLLPLGIPDVDKKIEQIMDKKDAVLFLDALDEDTLAIVDHKDRLIDLMNLVKDFKKVVITCRTQFFPKEEEIPRETGVVKLGGVRAGERAVYLFHKLYMCPFDDNQVNSYLKKCYPIFQPKKRKKAFELVEKMPQLSLRPMLLAHIKDLLGTEKQFTYSFQLYEEMVDAWLTREEGKVEGVKKEPLRAFCEKLAINIYTHRQERGSERIPREEIKRLAEEFGINVEEWQLTGRSLLNRDALGNCKFAHRSIMEYLFVKRFLEMTINEQEKFVWTDQMNLFLVEILKYRSELGKKLPNLVAIDLDGILKCNRYNLLQCRSTPKELSDGDIRQITKKFNYFDSSRNKNGAGIKHVYIEESESSQLVLDLSTNLLWQKQGSHDSMTFDKAEKWIKKLNEAKFEGFDDWRLPTVEEAMSLMEPEQKNKDLYIDSIFDSKQRYIWTCDKVKRERGAWVVSFDGGYCGDYGDLYGNNYVRAVRS